MFVPLLAAAFFSSYQTAPPTTPRAAMPPMIQPHLGQLPVAVEAGVVVDVLEEPLPFRLLAWL